MYLVCLMSLLGGPRREAIDKLIIARTRFWPQFMIRPVLTLLIEQSIAGQRLPRNRSITRSSICRLR